MTRPAPMRAARRLHLLLAASFLFLLPIDSAQAVQVQRVVSDKGIEAWLVEDHSNPVISMRVVFRGGAALDPAGKEGLADMASSLLDEGAGSMTAEAFQRRLKELGVELGFDRGLDTFGGGLRTLSEHADEAFRLLSLALTEPRFDPDAVERIRNALLANLRRSSERPGTKAWHRMQESFFPDHPYGRRSEGTPESIAAITIDDLKHFAATRFGRDNIAIGVSGDVTPEALKRLLDSAFAALPANAASWQVPEVAPQTGGQTTVIEESIPQSVILFGQQGLKRDHPDYYTATVMNHILGGGTFTSELFSEVREKRGLAYSVDSYLQPLDHAALILGNAGTANDRAGQTIAVVREVWRRMAEQGATPDDVSKAKEYLIGSFPLRLDSSGKVAGILAAMQIERLGIDYLERRNDYIAAVTADGVNALAKRLLHPGQLSFFVVGKPNLDPTPRAGTPALPAPAAAPPHH